MYFAQLMLTKQCNKQCHYCTTYLKDGLEVDTDYIKYVLDQFPMVEMGVELTGGEIGLIENIDDVYLAVKSHPKVKHIIALSNGLLRKRVSWIKDVEYWEHLIYDIEGRHIQQFYNDLDLDQDHRYVIVTTDIAIRSLLNEWDWFRDMGLFRPNFFYKLMNHKLVTPKTFDDTKKINMYWNELFRFYAKLKDRYHLEMLIYFLDPNIYWVEEKKLCQKWSPNLFIDIQAKEIGHCAINVPMSNKIEFDKKNLYDMMNGVYSENNYCEKCYTFDNGKNRNPYNNRSYQR